MTLELKTNVVVKNYIISALEMTIPSDYNAKLDFWKGDYVLNGALLHKPICKGFFSDIIFK
ncbi:hypothetical protein HN272_12075 [Acinetobacter baumannii]|uniref:hypothetical protein n=1 Tax=Acinetobacter baumannii TaxID=470 RepID=UPI001898C9F7|nr:hypothetical protein [Acinetobacter baumannii]MBF6774590.1 hypothetical protein [Acinetobacter baumannii]